MDVTLATEYIKPEFVEVELFSTVDAIQQTNCSLQPVDMDEDVNDLKQQTLVLEKSEITSKFPTKLEDTSSLHEEFNIKDEYSLDSSSQINLIDSTGPLCSSTSIIYNLINVKSFREYSFEEKMKIKQVGRPMPDMFIQKEGSSRGRMYKRHFNREVYARNSWICGCNETNALYCFPCVLFEGDKAWAKVGVTDLVHLRQKIKKHMYTQRHLQSQMELVFLGIPNVREQLDCAYWVNIQKFNEKVANNRYVLSKIIDCIKFCGVFELALHGHEEQEKSDNLGIFRGLINFTAELDKILAENLEKSQMFKGISKEIQNDILDCILEVCYDTILAEIRQSSYLAIMADDTTDVSAKSQLVIILRYSRNGEPVERFWTYLFPSKFNAESLTNDILNILDPILENSPTKLISQSYDGCAVMSGKLGGVQAKIKKKYPSAHFVHSYDHQLNLIVSKAASQNSQVRLFFGNLQEIPTFLKKWPECVTVLSKIIQRKLPGTDPTHWNYNIRSVNIVFEHREAFIDCMEEIEESFNNESVCSAASSIRRILDDQTFIFWLTLFNRVMPLVDTLTNEVKKVQKYPLAIGEKVDIFEKNIVLIRDTMNGIASEASNLSIDPLPAKKRCKNSNENDLHRAAVEACNLIVSCAKDRFLFQEHVLAASLFYSDQFKEYSRTFPEYILSLICVAYPYLHKERLKTELSVIYFKKYCKDIDGAIPFLKFIIENDLTESFTETKKLLEIIITTPMSTTEAGRCFYSLKHIKTFLRNSMVEERLVALSMLSIEKKMINEIPNFNEKVMDKFALKENQSMDLTYKK